MVLRFEAHPDNPQPRLIKQAADMLRQGAILAIPTDSSYALVCHLDDRPAVGSFAASARSTTSTTSRCCAATCRSCPAMRAWTTASTGC